jgi:hypothetical protein
VTNEDSNSFNKSNNNIQSSRNNNSFQELQKNNQWSIDEGHKNNNSFPNYLGSKNQSFQAPVNTSKNQSTSSFKSNFDNSFDDLKNLINELDLSEIEKKKDDSLD